VRVDIQSVKLAKQGDAESFASLYSAISEDLYKFALYTLGNSHDAEDAVSETFIDAFRGIKSLREDDKFKAWIFRILSIRCKRKISSYIKNKNCFDIDDFVNLLSNGTDFAEDTLEKTELVSAMEKLDSTERMIVVLSVLQGYTVKEISKILFMPQGTVSSKLYRSLDKLRNMLE